MTELDAWKYTIWWWKFKSYRAERPDNMLDYYQNKAIPKLAQVQHHDHDTPQSLPSVTPPDNDNGNDAGNGNETDNTLWTNVLHTLEKRINRPSFNTWLRPTQLLKIDDHTVQIEVPDEVFVYWLNEYYQRAITDILTKKLGYEPTVTFVVQSEVVQADAVQPETVPEQKTEQGAT